MKVPIFPGAPNPILGRQHQPHAPQAEALSKWKHRAEFPHAHALGFMRNVIRENPGEVVLLADHDDDATVRRALASGARGLLSRNCTVAQLEAALHAAVRGDYATSRDDLADRLADFVGATDRAASGGRITPRERWAKAPRAVSRTRSR